MPTFKSDASKITSKGMGLKKAYLGKQNQCQVNCMEAGKFSQIPHQMALY
jgi:filamin